MQTPGVTDEQLMERVARGGDAALDTLMRRYHEPLLAFICRQTDRDAEDIYQETWLRVMRGRTRYDPGRKFSTWLFQIALNLCRDAHRRHRARPRTLALEHAARIPADPATDQALHVRQALAALPPRDREIIALRYYLGFPESETASILGLPIGTVKSRAHTAAARLKKLLDAESC